jgi:hypothetical protein
VTARRVTFYVIISSFCKVGKRDRYQRDDPEPVGYQHWEVHASLPPRKSGDSVRSRSITVPRPRLLLLIFLQRFPDSELSCVLEAALHC